MSIVHFVKADTPCVRNEIIAWHQQHGWVWNVVYHGTPIAVFYCSLLCGDGVICHFETVRHIAVPPAVTLAAMRRGVELVAGAVNVVFATIPKSKWKLVRCALRLGFSIVSNYRRADDQIVFLQYLRAPKQYNNSNPNRKELLYEQCQKS